MKTRTHATTFIGELDSSGVPCETEGEALSLEQVPRTASRPAGLEKLVPTRVEALQTDPPADWFAWGCIDGRPVLFTVDAETVAELREALESGDRPTALVDPTRIVARRLD